MIEEFKPVPGYPKYQVSNLGRVKSFVKYAQGVMMSPRRSGKGYLKVDFYHPNHKAFYIHQLVAMAFLGHTLGDRKIVVDHINGQRSDNRLENLQVTTNRHNVEKGALPLTNKCSFGIEKLPSGYRTRVRLAGKARYLGTFKTEKEAIEARAAAIINYEEKGILPTRSK